MKFKKISQYLNKKLDEIATSFTNTLKSKNILGKPTSNKQYYFIIEFELLFFVSDLG